MTRFGAFGLMPIVTIMAITMSIAQTRAGGPEYSYPPLSHSRYQYYQQHPVEFQNLLKRLPPVSHLTVPGQRLAPGEVPAGGTWTSLTHPSGQNLSNPILLTDGTIIAHVSCTSNWFKFTPDNTGNYINGTWTQIASTVSTYT